MPINFFDLILNQTRKMYYLFDNLTFFMCSERQEKVKRGRENKRF